ncbi:hypothetical protein [Agrobacterium sp. M50-1]|uniref:hypothetical protein n=1 Tax=Agrobacterium sp. M50-1 TaxID=3132821 RepID=UPI003CE543EA
MCDIPEDVMNTARVVFAEVANTYGTLDEMASPIARAIMAEREFAEAAEAEARAKALEFLRKPFCVLFLDGRNEHGSHVIQSFPRSVDIPDADLDSDDAEAIIRHAESLGFGEGDHVWAEFSWNPPQIGDFGLVELAGYWEFTGVNVEPTMALQSEER